MNRSFLTYVFSTQRMEFQRYISAYYPFDVDYTDKITPILDLVSDGGTLPISSGKLGNSVHCPASTNTALRNISTPNISKTSFTNGTNDIPYSISVWVYITSVGSSQDGIIVGKSYDNSSLSSTNSEWRLGVNTATTLIRFVKYSEGTSANNKVHSVTCPSLNAWHHIAVTDDGVGNVKIYIDGVSMTVTTANSGTGFVKYTETASARFGCFNALGVPSVTRFLNGSIDDLGILRNYVLTANDVGWIYNGGNGRRLLNI